jgi:hypothetical protein
LWIANVKSVRYKVVSVIERLVGWGNGVEKTKMESDGKDGDGYGLVCREFTG